MKSQNKLVEDVKFDKLEKYTLAEKTFINDAIDFLSQSEIKNLFEEISNQMLIAGIGCNQKKLIASLEISLKNKQATSCVFIIKNAETLLGRSKECDIILADKTVSAKHAKIISINGLYYVSDLNSSNGTYLNGKRIAPDKQAAIKSGDVIKISNFKILFHCHFENKPLKPLKFSWQLINKTEPVISGICNNTNMVIFFKIHDIDDNIFIFLPADIIHAISYKALGIEMKKKIISNSIGEIEKSIIEYLSMRLSIFAREKNLAATFLSSCKSNEWIKQNTSLANYILTEVYTTIDKTMYSLYLLLPKNITLNNKSLSFKKIISINWAVNIPVIIGYSSVRLAELQEVKSGDILLLDTCYVNLDEDKLSGNAYMIINKKDFSCISCKLNTQRDAKASLEIDSFIKGGEMKNLSSNQISSEATSSKAEELGEQILKSIEVIVAIELCRIEMTLPEISSLKKGKLIPLNKDLDNDVFLSINQKIIGCGKLVEIDGKLGVKITGLNI